MNIDISDKELRDIEEATALLLIEDRPGGARTYGGVYSRELSWCGVDVDNVLRRLERKGLVLVHISGKGCYVKKHYYANSNAPARG